MKSAEYFIGVKCESRFNWGVPDMIRKEVAVSSRHQCSRLKASFEGQKGHFKALFTHHFYIIP
jgi:hypothetical protein